MQHCMGGGDIIHNSIVHAHRHVIKRGVPTHSMQGVNLYTALCIYIIICIVLAVCMGVPIKGGVLHSGYTSVQLGPFTIIIY